MIVGRKNTIVVTLENANDEPDSSLDGQTVQRMLILRMMQTTISI